MTDEKYRSCYELQQEHRLYDSSPDDYFAFAKEFRKRNCSTMRPDQPGELVSLYISNDVPGEYENLLIRFNPSGGDPHSEACKTAIAAYIACIAESAPDTARELHTYYKLKGDLNDGRKI